MAIGNDQAPTLNNICTCKQLIKKPLLTFQDNSHELNFDFFKNYLYTMLCEYCAKIRKHHYPVPSVCQSGLDWLKLCKPEKKKNVSMFVNNFFSLPGLEPDPVLSSIYVHIINVCANFCNMRTIIIITSHYISFSIITRS